MPKRQLIFVRDSVQWENDRKRIVGQLARYGFPFRDRMCISVALDEIVTYVTDDATRGGRGLAATVAYTLSSRVFRVRVRLVTGESRIVRRFDAGDDDHSRWLLASACMTDLRLTRDGTEIDMRRDNNAKVEEPAGPSGRGQLGSNRRVLLAEEDADVLVRLEEALRNAGYGVVVCTNGWDLVYHLGHYLAPDTYRKERFDVIVADTRLPGATGLDVLRGLRWQRIPPVLLIVGNDKLELARRNHLYGAAAIIERSIAPSEFLRVIHGIVRSRA